MFWPDFPQIVRVYSYPRLPPEITHVDEPGPGISNVQYGTSGGRLVRRTLMQQAIVEQETVSAIGIGKLETLWFLATMRAREQSRRPGFRPQVHEGNNHGDRVGRQVRFQLRLGRKEAGMVSMKVLLSGARHGENASKAVDDDVGTQQLLYDRQKQGICINMRVQERPLELDGEHEALITDPEAAPMIAFTTKQLLELPFNFCS